MLIGVLPNELHHVGPKVSADGHAFGAAGIPTPRLRLALASASRHRHTRCKGLCSRHRSQLGSELRLLGLLTANHARKSTEPWPAGVSRSGIQLALHWLIAPSASLGRKLQQGSDPCYSSAASRPDADTDRCRSLRSARMRWSKTRLAQWLPKWVSRALYAASA